MLASPRDCYKFLKIVFIPFMSWKLGREWVEGVQAIDTRKFPTNSYEWSNILEMKGLVAADISHVATIPSFAEVAITLGLSQFVPTSDIKLS